MSLSAVTAALVGALLFLLVAGAGIALYQGLRLRQRAASDKAARARAGGLMGTAPVQAMVVRADGRLDCPRRLADWLGLGTVPRYLAELSTEGEGLSPRDLETLIDDVTAAQRSGRGFAHAFRPQGPGRSLWLSGERAPDALGQNAVVIWVADQTDAQHEIARLTNEAGALRRAFEALTGLVEAAPLPMWYRDSDLRLAMVNTAYVDAVEAADAADAVNRGLELVDGGPGGPLAGAVAARDENAPQDRVLPATIGGERRALRLHDVPLSTGGVAGYAVDVEELEQAHGAQRRFQDAQRAMLDRLSAGVAQFGPDRALSFCNQPFRRLFAMRAEWLADRPEFDRVLERMREANRLPEVRDFPAWRAERRAWFTGTDENSEEFWHLSGGTHLRVVAQQLPDGGLLLIFEDRTEQVQLASARDTLLRVRTATFDNLFEALGVFAADGRLQLWNSRFRLLWGFEEEFLASHPRVDAFAEAAAHKLATPSRHALIGDLVRSATIDRQQRGGRVGFADGRHFEFAAVPLPDGNALFTMLDISDSRKIERALRDRAEALEEADRLKTAFVARMSYELRTPLTSISGFAEMLHGGYAGELPADARHYVEAILDSSERLGLLIDDVLDLTQSDAETALQKTEVDMAAVARAAADTLRPQAKRRGIDFAVEVQRSAGRITGDPRRLRESIEHLLRHALGAVADGGRVLLHADGNAARARVVVSDDGGGMEAEAASRVFDRFRDDAAPGAMTPAAISSGDRALGLGLPLAKQFIEAHGGTVALVSEPGAGTLITVELPRR